MAKMYCPATCRYIRWWLGAAVVVVVAARCLCVCGRGGGDIHLGISIYQQAVAIATRGDAAEVGAKLAKQGRFWPHSSQANPKGLFTCRANMHKLTRDPGQPHQHKEHGRALDRPHGLVLFRPGIQLQDCPKNEPENHAIRRHDRECRPGESLREITQNSNSEFFCHGENLKSRPKG